ncbi:APC family permease [Flavobacterium sp. MAH-1]|uniref:APC family permease n=1 Tax=Flavobacterium agri TaxID=2743471 RepID=A0A7Y8Y2C9_9FLAO|nr:APC family permease [Flavobacterium agri]NUY79940.1 APC family permease [Flavobacterium agri]NYA69965.1 APC family permease [Flavobacterium agri]
MSANPNNKLQKVLGLGFGIAIFVGGTIGVGILRTPGEIATYLDDGWLIVACWLIGGLYILMGCGAYSELATSIPKAGGSYNYIKRAFGDYAGFLSGWFDYITNAIAPAFFCIVISEYIAILIPEIKGQTTVVAVGFLIGFMLIHVSGVRNGSIVQQITSIIKVAFFVALIVACFWYSDIAVKRIPIEPRLMPLGVVIGFFKSLQMALGAYDGWYAVCFFAEEDENPNKNIPKSLYTGAIIVIAIYVVINMAFLHVLPAAAIADSPLAASDVAKTVFGQKGSTIVTVIAIFSIIGILNAYMMIPPRILYGLSRDGFFVKSGTKVNKGGTPIVTLLCSSAFTLGLILVGSFEVLFALATFMSVIVWGLAYCSLIKLRISEPDLIRPYKAWGYPFTAILLVGFSLAVFLGFAYSDRNSFLVIAAIAVVSYPIFRLIQPKTNST